MPPRYDQIVTWDHAGDLERANVMEEILLCLDDAEGFLAKCL